MHFDCPFATVQLQGSPAAQRVQELVSSSLQRQSFGPEYYELADLLFAVPFSWTAFDEWNRKFSAFGYRPRIWPAPAGLVITPDCDAVLSALRSLSVATRRAALSLTYPMPAGLFKQKYGTDTLDELDRSGHIEWSRTPAEKLRFLSLSQLRNIQKSISARGARNKAELAERISAVTDEHTLQALLPTEAKEDYVRIVRLLDLLDSGWVMSRRQIVGLYLNTLTMFFGNMRGAAYALQVHDKVETLQTETCCPVCSPFQNRALEVGRDNLPPYHPGCSCSVFPLSSNPARLRSQRGE